MRNCLNTWTEFGGVSNPSVGKSVPDQGRKCEIVKPTNRSTEILYIDILGRQQKVEARFGVDREWFSFSSYGRFNDGLDGEASERFTMGIKAVIFLMAKPYGLRYVGASLVSVHLYGAPPLGHGGGFGMDG